MAVRRDSHTQTEPHPQPELPEQQDPSAQQEPRAHREPDVQQQSHALQGECTQQAQHTHDEATKARYTLLEDRAQAFCSAFCDESKNQAWRLLADHFATIPKITQHGPAWPAHRLAWVGRTFVGVDGCEQYFRLQLEALGGRIRFAKQKDVFPGRGGIVVDVTAASNTRSGKEHCGVVCVVGNQLYSIPGVVDTMRESFMWRLSEFTPDGKIGHWEIWGDVLTPWLATEPRAMR